MQIKNVTNGELHTCTPETNLGDVAAMMVQHDCGAIPVVGKGAKQVPLGIVTDRDIVARIVARGLDPRELTAQDAMTTDPIVVSRDEDLERGMRLMSDNQVRRLLVVDENEDLAGVLSLADVVRARPDREAARTVEGVSLSSPDASGPAPG